MESIGAKEARTHWAALLDRVEQGEHVTITRRGVPVAVLSPLALTAREERLKAIDAIRVFSQSHTFCGSLREAIEEGRA